MTRRETLMFAAVFVLLVSSVYQSFSEGDLLAKYYAKQYYAGNYQVAEGEVKKLYKNSKEIFESFCVEKLLFDPMQGDDIGYDVSSGGGINRNGQQVRISYICEKDQNIRYIMKVEVKEQ